MVRPSLVLLLVLAACRGGGGDGSASAANLDDAEVADRFLELLAAWSGATLQADAPCPMENPTGDQFFHVLESGFPSHVVSSSPIEFPVTSSFGPGPMQLGGVVACVDGATGFLSIGDTTVEGMPMMDDPILLSVDGNTGSDAQIVGQTLAVSVGVVDVAGNAGTYATTLAQICADDGSGCEQACANPVAATAAVPAFTVDDAVCNADAATAEDGAFASLGRLPGVAATMIDGVVASQSCVALQFPPTATTTVRVLASWTRQTTCTDPAACVGAECGTGHGYGVWTTGDGGTTWNFSGIAQGSETTQSAGADPLAPEPPLVGEHFLPGAGGPIDGVLVCRLAHAAEADSVAVDAVQLCPP